MILIVFIIFRLILFMLIFFFIKTDLLNFSDFYEIALLTMPLKTAESNFISSYKALVRLIALPVRPLVTEYTPATRILPPKALLFYGTGIRPTDFWQIIQYPPIYPILSPAVVDRPWFADLTSFASLACYQIGNFFGRLSFFSFPSFGGTIKTPDSNQNRSFSSLPSSTEVTIDYNDIGFGEITDGLGKIRTVAFVKNAINQQESDYVLIASLTSAPILFTPTGEKKLVNFLELPFNLKNENKPQGIGSFYFLHKSLITTFHQNFIKNTYNNTVTKAVISHVRDEAIFLNNSFSNSNALTYWFVRGKVFGSAQEFFDFIESLD